MMQNNTRDQQFLVAAAFFLAIALVIGAFTFYAFGVPQSNNKPEQEIWAEVYDATNGAIQGIGIGRGVTTPQSSNNSIQQVLAKSYDATNGALQFIWSENSSDIPFTNFSSLTDGDLMYYDSTGEEWLNTQGLVGIELGSNQLNLHSNQLYTDGYQTTVATKNKTNTYIADSIDNVLIYQPEYWTGSEFAATSNYGFGHASLQNNTGAYSNGFGVFTLQNNTGDYSNGFGYASLQNNTGTYSNGLGSFSLQNNTGAYSNGFGVFTLQNNTGDYSNGFGYFSLRNNTGAGANGFGYLSLQNNIGTYSNGFGYLSLLNNTGASANGFGFASLLNNTGAGANGFGLNTLRYGQSTDNIAIGDSAWSTFLTNAGGAITFDNTDVVVATDRITVTGHSFGATNAYVNVTYSEGTSAITGLTDATIYQVKIIDANTVGFYEGSRGTNITEAGTGTGHTLTPQYTYSNSIVIGADTVPTASNQVTLGNSSTTSTILQGAITLTAYTRSITIPANAAVLGPTAPGSVTIGTYRGLGFDADAESANMIFEVPDDWDGASDMTLKIYWSNEPSDAVADTETVKWDSTYRVTAEGEDLDAGTAVSVTATYTQSGAGTDGEFFETEITLDFDDANQPLVADSVVGFAFDRDVTTDTYSGDAVVIQWEVDYTSVSIPKHD